LVGSRTLLLKEVEILESSSLIAGGREGGREGGRKWGYLGRIQDVVAKCSSDLGKLELDRSETLLLRSVQTNAAQSHVPVAQIKK